MSAARAAASPDPDPIPGSGDAARHGDDASRMPGAAFESPLDAGFALDERASLELCLVEPSGFDRGTLLEFLIRVAAEQSRLAAARVRLLAELSARDVSQDRWVAEEVGAALRLSPRQAMTEVKNAAQLHDELPCTFAQLAAGRVTGGQARLVTEASFRLPHSEPADRDAVAGFDAAAAEKCSEMSEPQTRQFLRRQVLRADPAGAERRHNQAVADRHVRLSEADDGMALLTALLPAPEATACMQRLDGAARKYRNSIRAHAGSGTGAGAPKDMRTVDQLRADLFMRTLLGTGTGTGTGTGKGTGTGTGTGTGKGSSTNAAEAPDGCAASATSCAPDLDQTGLGASINVIVSAATLLRQDDEPGWLDHYGPITAETARRIAHDPTGTWRRLVTDPVTGQVTDVGNRRYRPPAALRRLVVVRDGTCRFPYCTQPATGCDLDHAVPWPQGSTALENLHAVSRRHHRAKTHTRWRVTLDPDTGTATWISPTGYRTRTRPPQRWTMPDDTPARKPDHARDDDRAGGNGERRDTDGAGSAAHGPLLPEDPPF